MYKDCDIPAKLFFKIINTGDYSLIGEGTPEQQEQAFNDIFDEYFQISNNKPLATVYTKKHKIYALETTINIIPVILHAILFMHETEDERNEQIDLLNSIRGVKVKFDKNKNILEECLRVEKKVLGGLKNQLNIYKSEIKDDSKQATITFEKKVAWMSKVMEFRIAPNDISLYEYVEYEGLSREIVASYKTKQKTKK